MTKRWDPLLFASIFAIGAISLLIIFSINKNLAGNQLIFWIIGASIAYFASYVDLKTWQRLTMPLYIISLISLALLFFLAEPIRGSTRWVDLGLFRIQPSEIAKAATIFLIANFYVKKSATNIINLITSLSLILPLAVLVFLQPDIGSTLAFFGIWVGVSAVAGLKPKYILLLGTAFLIVVIFFLELLAPYQKQRITTFLNPTQDPLGTGYNIIQSKIAIGSGGIFGKGTGQGSQSSLNFLPEAESDFIFASTGEQLGLFGAGLLLALYATMISRLLYITKSKNRHSQLLIAAICSYFILQFIVNVGMNLGLLPVTGITLPLVSYGGSSLITTLFLLGVAMSLARYSRS